MQPAASTNNNPNWARHALLGFAFIAPFLAIYLLQTHPIVALIPLFLSHMLLLYATLVPSCQWWGPVVRTFQTSEKEVWLTIDDGPSPEHTAKILGLLEQANARATFFVIGTRAEKYPHLITEIIGRGHEVANHTYTHPSGTFWGLGPKRISAEIDLTVESLRVTRERPARWFRAPAGMRNLFVHPELDRRGLKLIGWTVRGFDTVRRDPAPVAERILRDVKPGAIILLHEGYRTKRDPDFALKCVELVLNGLTERGYRCVIP